MILLIKIVIFIYSLSSVLAYLTIFYTQNFAFAAIKSLVNCPSLSVLAIRLFLYIRYETTFHCVISIIFNPISWHPILRYISASYSAISFQSKQTPLLSKKTLQPHLRHFIADANPILTLALLYTPSHNVIIQHFLSSIATLLLSRTFITSILCLSLSELFFSTPSNLRSYPNLFN